MSDFSHLALNTARLELRPFQASDAPGVLAMFTDTTFMAFVASPPFELIDQAQALITRDQLAMANGERIRLGVVRTADGALIGNCTLFDLDVQVRSAELGYGLLGHACGQGYMHEALLALLAFGFASFGLNRVQAEINPRNIRSARSLDRLGFTREGLMRENCMAHGQLQDSALYALLRREWKASHL